MIESYLRANNLFVDYNEVMLVYCSFTRNPLLKNYICICVRVIEC